ncbi:MAG: hypothetical protein AAFY76_10410 [Cyanobacteria bacterium J06649_11]
MIGLAVASIFTGGWLAKKIFAGDRVENFKEDYSKKIIEEIEKQIREQHLEQKIDDHISVAFETLKQTLVQEVNTLLDNTQNTLTELSDKRGRHEALTETQREELNQIRAETERILGNAQRLSDELVEIMSV